MSIPEITHCRRGHARPKNGWCAVCGQERYAAMKADPVKYAAYIDRKTTEERNRYERSLRYRDKKNGVSPERRAMLNEREGILTPAEQAALAKILVAKADYYAKQAKYGIVVKEMRYL